jgi:predicted ester cyclase
MTHKALVHRFFDDLFTGGDLDCADDVAAAQYVEHAVAPFGAEAPGVVAGPEHLRNACTWLRAQFPDLHMTVEAIVEEGDLVAVRVLSRGTSLGALNGVLPPTGRRFTAAQSHWFRVEDGRLAEHWVTRDDLTTMIQLGVLTGPRTPAAPSQS